MKPIRRRVFNIAKCSIAAREAGPQDQPAFVLLHGWPQSSRTFEPVMHALEEEYYVLALDLPGVAASRGAAPSARKLDLAHIVREVIQQSGAQSVVLVGHDIGGTIVYSYLREFGAELNGAVIVSAAIPGIAPFEKMNLHTSWHFALHSIADLPETLVLGHQRQYFDYFFDAFAYDGTALSQEMRDAYASDYASRGALRAAFDWFRAFAEDERLNRAPVDVQTPVLYLRGSEEIGELADYTRGLKASGLAHLTSEAIPSCGHFAFDEAPEATAEALRRFRAHCGREKFAPVVVTPPQFADRILAHSRPRSRPLASLAELLARHRFATPPHMIPAPYLIAKPAANTSTRAGRK